MQPTVEAMEKELAFLKSELRQEKLFASRLKEANVAKSAHDKQRVINGDRCRHNMVFEYCAVCQAVITMENVKFPITIIDEDTQIERQIWLRTEVKRVSYKRYR